MKRFSGLGADFILIIFPQNYPPFSHRQEEDNSRVKFLVIVRNTDRKVGLLWVWRMEKVTSSHIIVWEVNVGGMVSQALRTQGQGQPESSVSLPQGQFNNNKKSMWIREKEVSPLRGEGNCRRKKMRPSSQIYQEEWEENLRNIPDSDSRLVA